MRRIGLLLAGVVACGGQAATPIDGEVDPETGDPQAMLPVAFECPLTVAIDRDVTGCEGFRACPEVIATQATGIPALAADGAAILTPTFGGGFLVAARDGSSDPELVMGDRPGSHALAADEDYVFALGNDANLWRYRYGDDTARRLVLGIYPDALALSDDHVYWGHGRWMLRIPKTGAELIDFVSENPHESSAYPAVGRPVVHGDHVYWLANYEAGGLDYRYDPPQYRSGRSAIVRAPVDGGRAETVVSAECIISDFAFDDEDLYWGHAESGTIAKRDMAADGIETVLTGIGAVARLVANDRGLFWLENGNYETGDYTASVFGHDKDGDAPILIASDLFYPQSLAVDDEAVFFTDNASSELLRAEIPW